MVLLDVTKGSVMSKVFIFSYYLPTQPTLEVELYNELMRYNINTTLVLIHNDPRVNTNILQIPFTKNSPNTSASKLTALQP